MTEIHDVDYDEILDLREFVESGYLQEVNRRFFHPLGLAMEILVDDSGRAVFGGIHDYRKLSTGVTFNLSKENSLERIQSFVRKRNFVNEEIHKRKKARTELFGSDTFIEPIPDIVESSNYLEPTVNIEQSLDSKRVNQTK